MPDPLSLPAHLDAREAQGLAQNEPIAQFEIGSMRNFIYLVLDWKTRKAAVVDPQRDLAPWVDALKREGFELEAVLLTHSHHDHVGGVAEIARRWPGVKIHLGAEDAHRLVSASTLNLRLLEDGASIAVGSLTVEVLHTPGHSAGECSYLVNAGRPYLFTGDTVFIRDCGRTDFPDGSNEQMFESLARIKKLAADTVLLVGHHYAPEVATTLARELESSPPMRCRSVQELASLP
jgi:hydroxyacylglutathione hydrolase